MIYSPNAGGLISDKVARSRGDDLPSRYTPDSPRTKLFHKPEIINALLSIHEKASANGITLLGASIRWLAYHSKLTPEDGIIFGASKAEQVDDSDAHVASGPLPQDVVDGFETLWNSVKGVAPTSIIT
jgi:aflatoxin B1 aldehyde reductase